MKRVRSIRAQDAVRDISPSKPPHGVPMARWSAGMQSGRRENKEVAWYRGHQAGIHESYLTLRKKYPRIAEEFRKAFGINKDGSYTL